MSHTSVTFDQHSWINVLHCQTKFCSLKEAKEGPGGFEFDIYMDKT